METALISGLVAPITSAITALVTLMVTQYRAGIDEKIAQLRAEIDRDLAGRRAVVDERLAQLKNQLDNRASYAAERVVQALLLHDAWTQRSFKAIKAKLGGFEDDKLRQILVQAGAVRFGEGEQEYWGLIERNRDKLV